MQFTIVLPDNTIARSSTKASSIATFYVLPIQDVAAFLGWSPKAPKPNVVDAWAW